MDANTKTKKPQKKSKVAYAVLLALSLSSNGMLIYQLLEEKPEVFDETSVRDPTDPVVIEIQGPERVVEKVVYEYIDNTPTFPTYCHEFPETDECQEYWAAQQCVDEEEKKHNEGATRLPTSGTGPIEPIDEQKKGDININVTRGAMRNETDA